MDKVADVILHISKAVTENTLLKITVGHKRENSSDIKNVFIKPVIIKDNLMLSFVFRYATKDITKNETPEAGLKTIQQLLNTDFFNVDVFTSNNTLYFSTDKNGKQKIVIKKVAETIAAPTLAHDHSKKRLIKSQALYLRELGVTGVDGHVKKDMQHKYRQINRYVEIIAGILKDDKIQDDFSVTDMGSGKGYLTFALYDYLHTKNENVHVKGVDLRKELVDTCNNVASISSFKNLHFVEGSIKDSIITKTNMLIALHACDTATDDAISAGIHAAAKYIICAPCCHKQIRKEMAPANALKYITTHGILLERQAEMVTDTIRSLIMEAYGYKTKVFDFIEQEDTPKNVLIAGTKSKMNEELFKTNIEKVEALKNLFGIKKHYLETLLIDQHLSV